MISVGSRVIVEDRPGIVYHIDESLPLPYSVGFSDNGEVCSYAMEELQEGL